ncbi:hypothetical protein D9611_002429 [Ephemerocybe angulata]|uniref:Uncharacterized protein n=1 Tax=Ephemerocybe angulata TaxID=980116 RepID=A0A8H5C1Y6_9AGAR|nr:hypothetical protein D9611_002429 [Tulosesus angulatus]
MPSIRIRNSQYSNIREVFDDQGSPATSPQPTAQTSPQFRDRPTSLPVPPSSQDALGDNDTPLISPISLQAPNDRSRRRRSNSRVHSHVMSTYSSLSRAQQRSGFSSTDVLNPSSSPNTPQIQPQPPALARRPVLETIEGSQTKVAIAGQGSPGVLGRTFPERIPSRSSRHGDDDYDDNEDRHHHDDIVEHLDAIDPQVGAFANLTNAANSILLPPMGFSRKPVIILSSKPTRPRQDEEKPQQFEDELDRHVDDVLQSPSKWRRTLMGVWSFLKTPMGILTGIYGFLVVFWGAAIIFFLAKFINFHNTNTQGFWVEVSSQVVNGLFTVTGVGFIPSRVLSTWRIWKIWKYKRLTISRRKDAGLPQLFDMDDLPDPAYDPNFVRVLSEEEHHDLHRLFSKSRESLLIIKRGIGLMERTLIVMALWICLCNDLNSVFQIILCGTMWGLNRFQRPPWSTGILIPAGFISGIAAAVLIWRGGERTKRVEEVRERLRAALLAEYPRPEPSPLQGTISRRTQPTGNIEQNVEEEKPQIVRKFTEPKPLPTIPPDSPELRVDEAMTVPKITLNA